MKIHVAVHRPTSHPHSLWYRCDVMDLDHTTTVSDFKTMVSKTHGIDYDAITVIYGGEVRGDSMSLCEGEFKPNAPHDRCYIHVQVCDLDVRRDVLRRLDAGETLEIPLDQVTIREA